MTFNPFWKRALLQFGGFTVRGSQPFFDLFTYDGARRTDVAEVVHAAFTGVAYAKERVYLAPACRLPPTRPPSGANSRDQHERAHWLKDKEPADPAVRSGR